MKVFTARFTGHYPVGTAAVIVAESREQAYDLLMEELKEEGLYEAQFEWGKPTTTVDDLTEIDTTIAWAKIQCNGNY